MRALLGISIAVALATTAGATLDPEPNSIGVYFDQGALTNSIEVEPWDPEGDTSGVFEAYIILTNMTEPIIEGFVVSFRIVYPPEMEDRVFLLDFRFGWPTPGGFYFIEPFADDISIGIAYPQYAEPVKVLVVWTLVILDDTWVEFYIGHPQEYGGGNAIAYYVGPQVNVVPFNFSTGNPDLPAARVNGPAPVTTRTTTFGSVKALYR